MFLEDLSRTASGEGLLLRGAFHPRPDDAVPPLPDGRRPGTLVLLGNAGPAMWPRFAASAEYADGRSDPLDRWTRRVVGAWAEALGAGALFPFGGPPYHPFVAWAKRAEAVAESPIGILIHPDHGLWHAYRAALSLAERLPVPPPDRRPRPCEDCAGRPCLTTCPVGAFSSGRYEVTSCAGHLHGPAGHDCMDFACRARRACPVGRDYAYGPEQARFHMDAFLGRRDVGAAP